VFVDTPCKLVVQFPAHNAHEDSAKSDEARNGNQERLDSRPDVALSKRQTVRLAGQGGVRIFDLIHLKGGVYQHGKVEHTYADDLNRVLQS